MDILKNEIHHLEGDKDRLVKLDGQYLDITRSQEWSNHSQEFAWGYGGSGPAQLALAVMLEITGSPRGYQDFKWKFIAPLTMDEPFKIIFSDNDIRELLGEV